MSDAPPRSRKDDHAPDAGRSGIDQLLDVMAAAARSGRRLPVGPRTELRDDCALHHRGSLRGCRGDPSGGPGGAPRRTGRPAAPGRLPRADGARGRQLRLRLGRARHRREDDSPPSPRLRRRRNRCPRARPRANPSLGVSKGGRARRQGAGRRAHAQRADGVALALPALLRAEKLQKRAARVGFDWPEAAPVFDKVLEEVAELREAAAATDSATSADSTVSEELGDLLFACVNLARHLGVEPEAALRAANAKFTAVSSMWRGAGGIGPRRGRGRPRRAGPAVGGGQASRAPLISRRATTDPTEGVTHKNEPQ